jgi:hypothetical protein
MIKELLEEHMLKAFVLLVIMGLILGLIGTYAASFLMAIFSIFNVVGSALGGAGG